MKTWPCLTIVVLASVAAVPVTGWAQVSPHIGYAYPAGGQQGASLEVTVGGQYLTFGSNSVHVSGVGVEARVVSVHRPMTAEEAIGLRDKLKKMLERKGAAYRDLLGASGRTESAGEAAWTAADDQELAAIWKKLKSFVPLNQLTAGLAETVTLRVEIAPDAEPGEREIRLGSGLGLSNPLRFEVGQLPEFSKPWAKIIAAPINTSRETRPRAAKSVADITLPATINGQIMPGGVDRYRFRAQKGQRLVIITRARELVPYLPDAVPGWFEATLTLYDSQGREQAYADAFRFHPDPVLYYEIPQDGEYAFEIRDSIYRGRQDFVYRVAIGELPFVTSIYPLGGPVDAKTTIELQGWNLPTTRLTPATTTEGINLLSVNKGGLISNRVPFAGDDLPECCEQEPNNQPECAQPISLPVIVNGRIGWPGDADVFCWQGRAGDRVVAEVYARRLDSPLDSVLELTDATGRQLACNDDREDKGSGLNTHHADSYIAVTLPADGAYYLRLTDAQQQGGREYAYRLRLSAPRPDFALRVVPSSLSVRGGRTVPVTVYALRKEGFSGEVALSLKDAPPGFTLNGAVVPANEDSVRLTLTTPPIATEVPLKISLEGRATIGGRKVVREAVPAEDMMQAFAYRHLVPAQELNVTVLAARFMPRTPVTIRGAMPVRIPVGGTARVEVAFATSTPYGNIGLELSEPPDGLRIERISTSPAGTEILLHTDAARVRPGLKGNLIVNTYFEGELPGNITKGQKKPDKRLTWLGSLPAIPFEIVGK